MANTPSARKAKGRRLQQEVKNLILESFKSVLEEDDVKVAIMGESGTDIKLSPLARKYFPYSIECKNQEKLNVWGAIKQAEDNAKEGTQPVVIFRRNNSDTFVITKLEHFMELQSLPPTIDG